jgi:tetratricopeptide (TPR) repeat protein
MTVNYCGSCGAANGVMAKFCRQCGTDLETQAAKVAPADAPKTTDRDSGNLSAASAKPQLRIVSSPSNKAAAGASAEETAANQSATSIPPPPPAPPLPRRARRAAREDQQDKRAAKIIEQKQEEDARQIKQTVASGLSQRLAQAAAGKPAPVTAQADHPATGANTAGLDSPARNSGPLIANAVPRVRTGPLPPNAARNSGPLVPPGSNSGKLSMPSSAAVAEASGLHEHPQAGLFLRLAAGILVFLLLGSGVYFYRNQRTLSANAPTSGRNLLSPVDQSEQLIQNAERARQGGQIETATADLSKAIELTPDQPGPRQLLAETFEGAGRADDALKAYDGLLKLTPENLSARLKVAELHRVKGNVSEARTQYQRIIAMNQSSPEATRALEAIEELDDTLVSATPGNHQPGLRPRRMAGRKVLGPVLPPSATTRTQVALIPQNPFAAPGARSGLSFNPLRPLEMPDPKGVAEHHKNLGKRYFNIGQFNAALKELHEAVRLTPDDKDLYYFLGSTYKGLKQLVKAFEYYHKCDAGPYAETAQSGAKQIEKPARKEFERQQKELLKATQARQAEVRKEAAPGKSFQNSFQE